MDYLPSTDFPEAIFNSSFDWNGTRKLYILATENDTLDGVSVLFLKLLTNRAQMFADVRTYWSGDGVRRVMGYELEGYAKEADGFIHLINSGACCLDACAEARNGSGKPVIKLSWEMPKEDAGACLKATTWYEADLGYFRGGGYSSRFETKCEMPIAMIRLNIIKGIGLVVQIAEGRSVGLPKEVSDVIWKRTDYTWPCTWLAPRATPAGVLKSAYDVMNNWGANRGAISYGHVGADVISLCSMLRVLVCTHNVPGETIFRLACWNAYGMDKEGQDFRTYAAYGPLYK